MGILHQEFYLREDVVEIAKELIGKLLVTQFGGMVTSGIIIETEAYAGITDRASHAFGGRRTDRTEIMYRSGGTAYIYLCYGVHSLFNVVTNREEIPHAILIRGILPVDGIPFMQERTGKMYKDKGFTFGPGRVSKALGIHYSCSGMSLLKLPGRKDEDRIWIEEDGLKVDPCCIETSPRVGIDYAGDDVLLPYRFIYKIKETVSNL